MDRVLHCDWKRDQYFLVGEEFEEARELQNC